jgi:hypothetical protein
MAAAEPSPSPPAPLPIDAETRLKLLVDEYKEAGAYCRNYELLTRTNNLVFMAFFAAMTGLVERSDDSFVDSVVFSSLGILGSTLFMYVGVRTRKYYLVYLGRAHEIEKLLGMDLLARGDRMVKTWMIPIVGVPFTNKTAFLSIQIAAMLYFFAKLIVALKG